MDELRQLALSSDAVLATTLVLPTPPTRLDAWWYYSLPSGQHVTFYTERSLDVLADQLGFKRSSAGQFHLFSHCAVPGAFLRLLIAERIGRVVTRPFRKRSLQADDYESITGKKLSNSE